VIEKTIKQMKRLQSLTMVDGDGRNDIEHQGEHKDHVLTTMENNPTKKAIEEKTKRMLTEVVVI
jgi:hypothetical protein